ncbi:MAG: SusC/RagA family TonB-linked outer membrane protein [Prevotella sp.]|nr:SusC/RagA family TonB-linked outer membrane protein [Prevotella sp.]
MKKRLILTLASFFLCIGVALAQTKVSGVVTSSEDGEPVIGASIKVVGTNTGTITDVNGAFTLNVPNMNAQIKVTSVGMIAKTLKVSPTMKIVLDPESTSLDDVVVLGYGSAQKVGTVIGSVTTVNSDKLKNAPSSSALDNLQGQVAGLSVLTSSGVAGDNATSVTLHGIGSLGASSTPLYVIDGIPSSSRTIMAMNPADIKSVTVLKDASATSIYGSRAANGVIYVTTKSGSYSSSARITVRSQYGWSTLANKKPYEEMMSGEQLKKLWLDTGIYSAEDLKKNYDDKGYTYNTKWYEIFQQYDNPQTQNDFSIEGGSDKVSYLVSASQFHQRGNTIGNFFDRYTFRTNLNASPTKWLKAGVNINMSYDKRQKNGNWGDSSNNANYLAGGLSYMLNPLYPVYDEKGQLMEQFPNKMWNPEYVISKNPNEVSRYGLVGSAYIQLMPIEGLKIVSRVGTDMAFGYNGWKSFPSYKPNNGSGSRGKSAYLDYSNTITNTIEYKFNINREHYFGVLAGQEGVLNDYDSFSVSSKGQLIDALQNLQNGLQKTYAMSESATKSKFLSFFGRFDYNYQEKYFFDASIRNDACSRFGKNNRNATFWAAGAMWKMKKEAFMNNVTWVNDLNLKVSYGTQGNASIGDYSSLNLMGRSTNFNEAQGLVMVQPAQYDLTWEKQRLLTFGVNGRLFNRLGFDIQYYVRTTSDMLMGVPYPSTAGFTELTKNVGSLENRGVDVRLDLDVLKGRDYFVNFYTTFNYNKQEITELFDGKQRWEIANTGVAYVVGSPVMYYYPIYAGINPETGEQMWYKSGDNVDVTTKNETTTAFDEASLTQNTGKKRFAPVNGGFGITAGWKGLSLAVDFAYVLGKYLINNDAFFYNNPNVFPGYNQRQDAADYWTAENKGAKFPNWAAGASMKFDTHLLENASFLRLKNLAIGYDLPKSLFNFQNVVQGIKFTVTGRNLLTATSYTGIDPEIDTNLSLGRVGNSKQILLGVELTF